MMAPPRSCGFLHPASLGFILGLLSRRDLYISHYVKVKLGSTAGRWRHHHLFHEDQSSDFILPFSSKTTVLVSLFGAEKVTSK